MTLHWCNTEKNILFFRYNTYLWLLNSNRQGDPFDDWGGYSFKNGGFVYPKQDLSSVDKFETKKVNSDSVLYFDPGSGFPRFKLNVSGNKRCIKVPKADIIVVSGDTDYATPSYNYIVIEDDAGIYFVSEDEFDSWFNSSFQTFITAVSTYRQFSNPKLIYKGRVTSYTKQSVYLAKYACGEYTLPYITDKELDKIICTMCPEPTYDEMMSLVDMLNSEDASIVQLALKMIAGYNVDKYKLTFRLILYTRTNWYMFTQNTVATKQLMETLNINRYYINDNFSSGAIYAQRSGETYTVEDIALAKQISKKLIKDWLQWEYKRYFLDKEFEWLPDERKVIIE